jgi:hypothetical protein
MNIQTLHHLYIQRLPEIGKIIDIESKESPDLRQERLLGAYQALRKDPFGTDRFLLNKAKWEMVESWRKGKSVDNGFYKRKDLKKIRYDHLPTADGLFAEAISSNGQKRVDDMAIFRIDLERFLAGLSDNERFFIKAKVMDGSSDPIIRMDLGVTFKALKKMKEEIRQKLESAFAV